MRQQPPAQPGMSEADIETPALVVDLDALEFNLDEMARRIAPFPVGLRPHGKTHKCPVIAQLQRRRGAAGLCVQKIAEAEAMVWGGIDDILVTNQIVDPRKLARAMALQSVARLTVCADSPVQVARVEAVARAAGTRLSMLVEIDVGGRRCGLDPGEPVVDLARAIANSRHLRFAGLQAYHGPAQHLRCADERRQAIATAVRHCEETVERLARAGIACDVVSGAGTGTFELEAASGIYTEIQAGSYCFMDGDYADNLDDDGRPVRSFRQALFVLATVISTARTDVAVLDAGHKAVSPDRGMPGVWRQPGCRITSLSDEHARMTFESPSQRPEIGSRVKLVPRHCDPTVDRFDWYVGVRGGRVECLWPISGRGGIQ